MAEDVRPRIQSIQFNDGFAEITYSEPHEQGEQIAIVRVCMFSEVQGGRELWEVQEALGELLDAVLRRIHAPTETRPSRKFHDPIAPLGVES